MAKTAKAPPGFYSATAAMRRLRMPKSTFYEMIEKGTIKKVTPPGRRDGYYLKAAIDNLAKARDLFTVQYALDPPNFEKATEKDIQGIYDLTVSLWGTRIAAPYETRLARYRRNSNIYYVLKYLDVVVGYSSLIPMATRAIDAIIETGKPGQATLDEILPFTPGTPIEYAFMEIAVRDEVPKPKQYAMHLISGTSGVIDDFARKDVLIKNLFAISSTTDGIGLCRKLGFKEIALPPNGEMKVFLLNLATSTHPLAHEYQEIIKQQ